MKTFKCGEVELTPHGGQEKKKRKGKRAMTGCPLQVGNDFTNGQFVRNLGHILGYYLLPL